MDYSRNDDVTLGEVYRRLVDVDERHGHELAEIKRQVQATNGRTGKLEARVEGHDRELHDLKRHPPLEQPMPPELRELLEIARDAKGVARVTRWLWAVGAALVPLVLWWISVNGMVGP